MKTLTKEQLKKIFPNAKEDKIDLYLPAFTQAFPQYGMTTPRRVAAFLGQIGVESGELKYDEELRSKYNTLDPKDPTQPTGNAYEGRKATLGNYVPNDGAKYIGRGIIQLTGRANYTLYGQKIGVDLIKYPERAKEPLNSVKIALEFWKTRGCNAQADAWRIDKVTELVNGKAKLHLDKRQKISERALKVLMGEQDVKE